jgi:hypothetical protein
MTETTDLVPRLGRIMVGSWTFPWAIGTVKEHLPHSPMNALQLVEKTYEFVDQRSNF